MSKCNAVCLIQCSEVWLCSLASKHCRTHTCREIFSLVFCLWFTNVDIIISDQCSLCQTNLSASFHHPPAGFTSPTPASRLWGVLRYLLSSHGPVLNEDASFQWGLIASLFTLPPSINCYTLLINLYLLKHNVSIRFHRESSGNKGWAYAKEWWDVDGKSERQMKKDTEKERERHRSQAAG